MYCAVTASWCASPERTAYFGVMPNGHTTQLTFPRQEVFDVGDVLLVGTDFYRKVPHDVWPLKPRVGIVRRALNEGVVLETSDGLGPDGAHFGTAFERVERRPELRHHRPIGTFVVLITVARPCGSRRVGLSFLSRGK